MENIKISTAQFENRSGDKAYNLSIIDKLSQKAALEGSQVVAFHECSITGYTFARTLSKELVCLKKMQKIICTKHTSALIKMGW